MSKKKEPFKRGPVLSKNLKPHLWVLGPLGWQCWGFRPNNTYPDMPCPWACFEYDLAQLRKWNHTFFVEWL